MEMTAHPLKYIVKLVFMINKYTPNFHKVSNDAKERYTSLLLDEVTNPR